MDNRYIAASELLIMEAYIGSFFYIGGALLFAWYLKSRCKKSVGFSLFVSVVCVLLAIPSGVMIWFLGSSIGLDKIPGFHGSGFLHLPAFVAMLFVSQVFIVAIKWKEWSKDDT